VDAGERALVIAPLNVSAIDQAVRGGVWTVAVVDLDHGSIEPALSSTSYRTPRVSRRHRNPRWCRDPLAAVGSTTPSPRLIDSGTVHGLGMTEESISAWHDVLHGIVDAWHSGAAPVGTFAQEFVQFAITCGPDVPPEVLDQLADLGRGHATPRAVCQLIEGGRRLWRPVAADPTPVVDLRPPEVPASVTALVTATTVSELAAAAHTLFDDTSGRPWTWLTDQSGRAVRTACYRSAALIAWAAVRWNARRGGSDPSPETHRLGATPRDLMITLCLDGFEACNHLAERDELVRAGDDLVDVDTVREACLSWLRGLGHIPRIGTFPRYRRPRGEPTTVTRPRLTAGTDKFLGTVFLSYQRDDLALVQPIIARLKRENIDYWIDVTHLKPGVDWQREIKQVIRSGGAFVPFFSPRYMTRHKSFMNVELREAIMQAQLMRAGTRWLIPAKLAPCEIPDMTIDGTTDLTSLHYIDFSTDWSSAMDSLVQTLREILRPAESGPGTAS
jgi:hypothetical protein